MIRVLVIWILWLALVVLALATGADGLAIWIFRNAAKAEDMRWD
jgi:hypothetical protein